MCVANLEQRVLERTGELQVFVEEISLFGGPGLRELAGQLLPLAKLLVPAPPEIAGAVDALAADIEDALLLELQMHRLREVPSNREQLLQELLESISRATASHNPEAREHATWLQGRLELYLRERENI